MPVWLNSISFAQYDEAGVYEETVKLLIICGSVLICQLGELELVDLEGEVELLSIGSSPPVKKGEYLPVSFLLSLT